MKLFAIYITNNTTVYGEVNTLRQAVLFVFLGNPTTYRGKTATWVNGRRLASYDGHTFTYDGQGRRLSKNTHNLPMIRKMDYLALKRLKNACVQSIA